MNTTICSLQGLIATGSWDKYVKLWDPRTNQCTGSYEQPEKVCNCVTVVCDGFLLSEVHFDFSRCQLERNSTMYLNQTYCSVSQLHSTKFVHYSLV